MRITLTGVVLAILSVSPGGDTYTVRDFFAEIDPQCISAEEPISMMERDAIVASGFAVDSSMSDPFSVVSVEADRLELRNVDIHLHRIDGGGYLVSVTSILGSHGENQHSSFYSISLNGEIAGMVSPEDLGITDVLNNEFLDPEDHFPDEENRPVPLYIVEDGSFIAEPWTWMNPDWLEREIVNRIMFVWTDSIFNKEITRLTE